MKKVVLAYSGGLDTSVAVAWLREQYGVEVVTLTVDLGGGSIREGVERRAMSAGASKAYVVDAQETFVSQYVWRALQAGAIYQGAYPLATALARPLLAQLLVEVAHAGGRRRRRARLHRQGQRPGPVRRRRPRPRPGARGRRADAGRHGPHPRPVDRLRERARHRAPDHEVVALLDRRQPVGPLVRDRRARGPVGHAAGRRLRLDRQARRRAGSGRHRHRLRGRHPGLDRRRAAGRRRARRAAARPGRRARRRPDRPRRGPAGRHQEPRDLRGAGGGRSSTPRTTRSRASCCSKDQLRFNRLVARRARPDHLRRPVVQRPVARPADVRAVERSGSCRARSGCASTTARRRSSAGARRSACTTRTSRRTTRATRSTTRPRSGSSRSSGSRSGSRPRATAPSASTTARPGRGPSRSSTDLPTTVAEAAGAAAG